MSPTLTNLDQVGKMVDAFPVRVFWSGWESDTNSLRQKGWKVFASESYSMNTSEKNFKIALRSPHKNLIISGDIILTQRELYFERSPFSLAERFCNIGVQMKEYRETDMIRLFDVYGGNWTDFESLKPCDGFAHLPVNNEYNFKHFKDLHIFKYDEPSHEIFLPQASVDQCLNRILEVQYPQQQEIKKLSLLETAKPVLQAKIYTLAA